LELRYARRESQRTNDVGNPAYARRATTVLVMLTKWVEFLASSRGRRAGASCRCVAAMHEGRMSGLTGAKGGRPPRLICCKDAFGALDAHCFHRQNQNKHRRYLLGYFTNDS